MLPRRPSLRVPVFSLLLLGLCTLPMLQAPRRAVADGGFLSAPSRVDLVHDHTRNLIYITSGNQVLRWSVGSGSFLSPITGFRPDSQLYGLDISPDDRRLLIADRTYDPGLVTVWDVDLQQESVQPVRYARDYYESGSYAVAFGNDGAALITSTFQGSGSVSMRRWDPKAGTLTRVADVNMHSMVTASADGSVIGIAEANSSGGPLSRYRVSDGNMLRRAGTGWFNFEVGVSRNGSQYAVPTYGGTFLYDANHNRVGPIIGTYAGPQPIGAVYHPRQDLVYFPWAQTNEVRVFDTNTFTQVGSYNFEHAFTHTGNWAFGQGRMRISRDGALLMATVNGGVRVVTLGERQPVAHFQTVRTLEDLPVSFRLTGSGANGTVIELLTAPQNGTLAGEAPDLTYTPAPNSSGQDGLQFRLAGEVSSPAATVTLVTLPVNDAPSFVKGADQEVTDTDGTRLVSGWATQLSAGPNETGQALSFLTANDNPSLFSAQPQIGSDGTLRFTPQQGMTGLATVTVQLKDNGGTANGGVDTSAPQTFTINVRSVNKPPVAEPDAATTAEDTVVTVDVLANDTDPDGDALTIAAIGQPIHGSVKLVDGKLVYTPPANYSGTDYFSYTLKDARGGVDAGNVSVTITPVNDAPRAVGEVWSPYEDTAQSINLFGADADGDPLTYTVVTLPVHGTLTGTAPRLTYMPAPNYFGPDSFTFKVNDGQVDSNVATTTLNVRPLNDPPTVQNETATTAEDTPITVDALANDSDADGDVLLLEQPFGGDNATVSVVNGKLSITPRRNFFGSVVITYRVNDGSSTVQGRVDLTVTPVQDPPIASLWQYGGQEDTPVSTLLRGSDPDGDPITYTVVSQPANGTLSGTVPNLTYTPRPNYFGTDTFTFKVNDGQADSNVATIYVSIQSVDDAPVGMPDSYATDEDTRLFVSAPGVLGNDSDVEGSPLVATRVTNPTHGTLGLNSDGSFAYTPEPNYHGPDSFTYRVSAGTNASAPVTVLLTVRPVEDAPVSSADSYETDEDTVLTVGAPGVLSNDTDADGDALSAAKVSDPAHGTLTLNANGSFTYQPKPNFYGTDSFSYRATGGAGTGPVTQVTLVVRPVNDAPVAVADAASVKKNSSVLIPVLANDSDPDGDALTVISATAPRNGSVVRNADGTIQYKPKAGYNGTDSFSYTLRDAVGLTATATVTVTVRK